MIGAVDLGGTNTRCCAYDLGREEVVDRVIFPTTSPAETLECIAEFFARHPNLEQVGIASFGPLDLDRSSPTYGRMTTTPKVGWVAYPLLTELRKRLAAPVAIAIDNAAAALAEVHSRRVPASHILTFVGVGTGLGAASVQDGRLLSGYTHPEFGHVFVPRHPADREFPGTCPYHGDCLEGLASGVALRARWGVPAEQLAPGHEAWRIEGFYLAHAVATIDRLVRPHFVVIGGGVSQAPGLRDHLIRHYRDLSGGYDGRPDDSFEWLLAPSTGADCFLYGGLHTARSEVS
jgi:fructokinase